MLATPATPATSEQTTNYESWINKVIRETNAARKIIEDNEKKEAACLEHVRNHPMMSVHELFKLFEHYKLNLKGQFFVTVQCQRDDLLQSLLEKNNTNVEAMSSAFQWAAGNGRLTTLNCFKEGVSAQTLGLLIDSDGYVAFQWAAATGELDVLKYLAELQPEKCQTMIEEFEYHALLEAVRNGKVGAFLWMIDALTNDSKKEMIEEEGFNFFHIAHGQKDWDMAAFFITYPAVFVEVLKREYKYRSYLDDFIKNQLIQLREGIKACEEAHPGATPDLLNKSAASLYFYILKYLIHKNSETLEEAIRLFKRFPSIKALLHTEVTTGKPNELFELAWDKNNQRVLLLLLEVYEIRKLAEKDHGAALGEVYATYALSDAETATQSKSCFSWLTCGFFSDTNKKIHPQNKTSTLQQSAP
ncbi:MAG: hypothetical protein QNK11_07820 [Legionella sp.]|nr:hypothetical protein [Legionella sp.]